MSFGSAFGAFVGGAAGGAALGKGMMESKAAKEAAAIGAASSSDSGGSKPVGFGLGQDLVSGTVGTSKVAGDTAQPGSGPWSTLSGIVSSLGGAQKPIDVNNPLGNGVNAQPTT